MEKGGVDGWCVGMLGRGENSRFLVLRSLIFGGIGGGCSYHACISFQHFGALKKNTILRNPKFSL